MIVDISRDLLKHPTLSNMPFKIGKGIEGVSGSLLRYPVTGFVCFKSGAYYISVIKADCYKCVYIFMFYS